MKKIIKFTVGLITVVGMLYSCNANARVNVRGHYRSNGTYVQPHSRSNPDSSIYNNDSYRW